MRKSSRYSMFVLIAIMLLILVGCPGCSRIEPGHVGVKVTYGGADKGVSDFPAVTGWVFYAPFFQTVFQYPTFIQVATWTRAEGTGRKGHNDEITFNSKEGMVISGDVSLAYQIMADKVPWFYVQTRSDDLEIFTHGLLRNIAMDEFTRVGASYSIDDLYGPKKEEFIKEVQKRVQTHIDPFGAKLFQFGFIGDLRLPPEVKQSLNLKIQATQNAIRAENQVREEKAKAQIAIAKAEGEAKSNLLVASSLTPQMLEWRKLQIAEWTVGRWNGVRPIYEGVNSNLMFAAPGK